MIGRWIEIITGEKMGSIANLWPCNIARPSLMLILIKASKSISGVLYLIVIYLGYQLPDTSSDLTRKRSGPLQCFPIWSCSGWGLPSRSVAWTLVSSYLTVPPLPGHKNRAVCFCGTSLGVTPTGRYPASCPKELRLSSDKKQDDERA